MLRTLFATELLSQKGWGAFIRAGAFIATFTVYLNKLVSSMVFSLLV